MFKKFFEWIKPFLRMRHEEPTSHRVLDKLRNRHTQEDLEWRYDFCQRPDGTMMIMRSNPNLPPDYCQHYYLIFISPHECFELEKWLSRRQLSDKMVYQFGETIAKYENGELSLANDAWSGVWFPIKNKLVFRSMLVSFGVEDKSGGC